MGKSTYCDYRQKDVEEETCKMCIMQVYIDDKDLCPHQYKTYEKWLNRFYTEKE